MSACPKGETAPTRTQPAGPLEVTFYLYEQYCCCDTRFLETSEMLGKCDSSLLISGEFG